MKKSIQPKMILTLIGLLSITLSACLTTTKYSPQESEPVPEMTTQNLPPEKFELPAPLFYLQNGQIWRLDPDAQSTQQLTNENAPIESFDLSVNGMLAYISNNSLITSDSQGNNRQVLRAGPALPPISDELARLNDFEYITTALRTPCWSPDGQKIAFIENGLQIFNLKTGQADMVWRQSTTSSNPTLFEGVLSWSPDGRFILLDQYTYPIENKYYRWISLLQLGESLHLNISPQSGGSFAWSSDAGDLFLANQAFGSEQSLMRCKPETAQCQMIAEFEPARWYYHYAFPFVSPDGRLLVLMGASNDPVQQPQGLKLISVRQDGYGRNELRRDSYKVESGLWAPAGNGVLIRLAQGTDDFPAGSTLWLSVEDVPAVPLPLPNATNLRWGVD